MELWVLRGSVSLNVSLGLSERSFPSGKWGEHLVSLCRLLGANVSCEPQRTLHV